MSACWVWFLERTLRPLRPGRSAADGPAQGPDHRPTPARAEQERGASGRAPRAFGSLWSGPSPERLDYLRGLIRADGGRRWYLPAPGTSSCEPHLLMAWWAVLHTLSMLARYQPAAWAKLIAVDTSLHVVPIERFLQHAIDHLPALVEDTIMEVSK
ncbi:YaaC family protein [Streptomyces sp. KS 21]|uniref:YaaC family protein n=1 Tax=Streptomyces sp. KS 21 TaxID=2485150 RepID=UPI001414D845|nr:YaaC family protein [Streptomyces sp. KS 21]